MADSRADFYMKLQDRLKADRGNWEIQWTEIAERVSTKDDDFLKTWAPGSKRQYHVFDSTAMLAIPKFAAAMESMLTPRTQTWHKLVPMSEHLTDDPEVLRYLDAVNKALFRARYAPSTNFATQMQEVYRSLGLYGTGALFVDDAVNDMNTHALGLRYKSIFLGELFIMENAVGSIDHVHRRYELTARQAAQKFDTKRLPKKIVDDANDHPDAKYDFLHVVCPNPDRQPRMMNFRGMPFASFHISYLSRDVVQEGGYRSQPYAVSRYVTSSREVYGRSPAIDALPDIKMANAQKETLLRAGHLAVEPPMLLNDDGILAPFDMRPGANNYGMISPDGKPLAMPMQFGANLELGAQMIDDTHRVINEAFLVTLFQILVDDQRQMTAYEVMQRAQEKGALMAPVAGRQQSELLGPIIQREIDILAHAGVLPPMPKQLQAAGGEFDITYQSPLARAQKAEQAIGLTNTIGVLQPLAQLDPSIMDRFNFDKISEDVALDINGLPATWLATDDELAAKRQARQQQQQTQTMIDAAPAASSAAANIAKLQQAAGSGGGVLPNLSALAGATQGSP